MFKYFRKKKSMDIINRIIPLSEPRRLLSKIYDLGGR